MIGEHLTLVLLAGSVILLLAVVAVRAAVRTGLPSLLIYLGIGLAIGDAGLGIRFSDAALTQSLGLIALAVILAEGGLTARWDTIRPALGPAALLSTVGVVVSVAVTAVIAHWVLATDWRTAILLGAVVSGTDAAAVFSVLRRLPLRGRLAAVLEAESGFNDAPVVLLVTLVVSNAWVQTGVWVALGTVAYELVVGVAVGLLAGWIGQQVLSRLSLPVAGLYPLAIVAFAMLSYAGTTLLHASGFLAVYLTGLWLGNSHLPHRHASIGFVEALAWLAQIGMFVLLGLLASPLRLPTAIIPALVIGTGLLLLARPLSVLASSLPFRIPLRDQAFLSWAGLRGAVPIVLATIPLATHSVNGELIFDVVFVLVFVFTLIQAPTLPWVARRLNVVDDTDVRNVEVEVAPLDQISADLLSVTVPPHSRLHGSYVLDLRLPEGAVVSLVTRGDDTSVPSQHTRLAVGDTLLVVAADGVREEAERRLRAVGRAGPLARWFGESGR